MLSVPEPANSSLIGESEFAGFFSAAQYAEREWLYFTTSITITWSRMGLTSQQEIRGDFLAFIKCMRDWLGQRRVIKAWVFVNECGGSIGLHTHIALHLPRERRVEFRAWAKAWAARRYGRHIPRAIRVNHAGGEAIHAHWRIFSYMLKGYDRDAVVLSADNAADGREVMLGDLIAYPWRDPGYVEIERLGWSPSLAKFTAVSIKRRPAARPYNPFGPQAVPDMTPPPFRSSFAEGARDVRLLYPKAFRIKIWPQAQ